MLNYKKKTNANCKLHEIDGEKTRKTVICSGFYVECIFYEQNREIIGETAKKH